MWLVGVVSRRRVWLVRSMDDNFGEWVQSMGVASGRGSRLVGGIYRCG